MNNDLTGFGALCSAFAIPISQDWLRKPFIEAGLRAQEARHQEVEQAPQLQDIILNRRPRQYQAMVRLHHFDSLGQHRLRILDHMPLIQYAVMPFDVRKVLHVIPDDIVRRDDDIELAEA